MIDYIDRFAFNCRLVPDSCQGRIRNALSSRKRTQDAKQWDELEMGGDKAFCSRAGLCVQAPKDSLNHMDCT